MANTTRIVKIVAGVLLSAILVATLVVTILILVTVLNENESRDTDTSGPTTNMYTYEGQVTDRKSTWDAYLSNPGSRVFQTAQKHYRQEIQGVLDKGFMDSYAYVTYFSNDANHVRVYFTIGLSNSSNQRAPSAKAVQIEMEKRAIQEHKDWSMLVVSNMVQNTLPSVSMSKGWKDAAEMFLSAIDTSVDPCDDFYAFSCNNFLKSHPLNQTNEISRFSMLNSKVLSQLQDLLSNYSFTDPRGPKSVRTAALFYNSCIKSQSDQYEGAQRLLTIMDTLGGWPIITPNWDPPTSPFDQLSLLMGTLSNTYGVDTLLSPGIDIDLRNVSRHRLNIAQATLSFQASLHRTPEIGSETRAELFDAIHNVAMKLANVTNVHIDSQTFHDDTSDMVDLEYKLAMISVLPDQKRNQTSLDNPYTIASAQQKWPVINWAKYMDALVQNHAVKMETLEMFNIEEPSYQSGLANLLSTNYSSPAGVRILQNYLIWRFISAYVKFGGPEFMKLTARISNPETSSLPPKESSCADQVREQLPWAIGRMYVDKHFGNSERMKAGIMTSVVLSAFRGQLSGLQWMDDLSKLLSIRKIYYLVKNVGYPDFIKNDTQLDKYHDWINDQIDGHPDRDYMDFTLDLVYFRWDKDLQLLAMSPDRKEFLMSPTTVNAWYQPGRNSITLPAAILNPPFYRADFPMAINYGGIGAVMGHELTHGFDDQGIQYDYEGTLKTWMGPTSQTGFTTMSTCAVQQYSTFCYDIDKRIFCLNGATTQGENIGDNGGLKAAYQAYKSYVASNGEEPRLPGMESFTMDQLFFLSYGNIWCSVQSDKSLIRRIITNPHSPAQSRVNGTLQNFEPFAAAFGCRRGDRMFPVKHCDIW